ncbi:MAG: hypothetical protein ABSC19_16875 [Syntrophorhabdales bacterium]
MSRVRNADEFLLRLRGIRADYERKFGPLLKRLREKYVGKEEQDFADKSLEAHARTYVVNGLLEALNWRLDTSREDGLPDLVPESPILSSERNTIRFLDYLGFEKQTDDPLLIVETKRLSAELARTFEPATTYSEVVSRGLGGERLNGEWNDWLTSLGDHVRSAYSRTGRVPKRVLLTNGDWLVAFMDPFDAFLEGGTRDPDKILVAKNAADLEKHFADLFLKLEHQNVLAEAPPLTPGQVAFYLSSDALNYAMRGIRLCYIDQRGVYQHSPVIKVAPVMFLGSRYGGWLRVEAPPQDYEIPYDPSRLRHHLAEVKSAADSLLKQVSKVVGVPLQPSCLLRHYDNETAFQALHAVTEYGQDEFLIVTGDKTHYFRAPPRVAECRFHDWTACDAEGVAADPEPLVSRSVSPRSFFISTEPNHCAHRDVASAKAAMITETNRTRCGARSGRNGQAFCEIWALQPGRSGQASTLKGGCHERVQS